MFEFGRELRRWFGGEGFPGAFQDGLTGGDGALLEMLALDMLRNEARAADVAAGRISAKDRPQRQLEAAFVWREVARRTGDTASLRKAAAYAEQAAAGFGHDTRPRRWAAARCEQAMSAMVGAELFGDNGLHAAADFALAEAIKSAGSGVAGALGQAMRALIEARAVIASGDREAAMRAAARFEAPINALDVHARRGASAKLLVAGVRVDRAEMLAACGTRLKDPLLLRMALDGLSRAGHRLDPAYEPLTWARVAIAHGQTRAALGELEGDVTEIAEAVNGTGVRPRTSLPAATARSTGCAPNWPWPGRCSCWATPATPSPPSTRPWPATTGPWWCWPTNRCCRCARPPPTAGWSAWSAAPS